MATAGVGTVSKANPGKFDSSLPRNAHGEQVRRSPPDGPWWDAAVGYCSTTTHPPSCVFARGMLAFRRANMSVWAYREDMSWLQDEFDAHPRWLWLAEHIWELSLLAFLVVLATGCAIYLV